MQRIERYGVIALILLLVTIAAVSFWEDAEESRAVEPELNAWRGRVAQAEAAKQSTPSGGSRHTLSGNDRGIAGELPATAGSGERQRNDRWRRGRAPVNARSGGASRPSAERSLKSAGSGFKAVPVRPSPESITDPGWVGDETGIAFRGGAPADPRGPRSVPLAPDSEPDGEDVTFPAALAERGTTAAERPRSEPRNELRQQPESRRMHEVRRETNPPASSPKGRSYVVQGGDTLSQIAEKQLGSSKRWPEIQQLNGGIDPSRIYEGLELRLPAAGSVAASTPRSTPTTTPRTSAPPPVSSTTYLVKKGDMLSTIAEKRLGSSKRWPEIAALNPEIDPDRVIEGTRLRMPAGARARATGAPASSSRSSSVAQAASAPRKKNRVR